MLYGAVNIESKKRLPKILSGKIDRFFNKLLRAHSGVSKKFLMEILEDYMAYQMLRKRTS